MKYIENQLEGNIYWVFCSGTWESCSMLPYFNIFQSSISANCRPTSGTAHLRVLAKIGSPSHRRSGSAQPSGELQAAERQSQPFWPRPSKRNCGAGLYIFFLAFFVQLRLASPLGPPVYRLVPSDLCSLGGYPMTSCVLL